MNRALRAARLGLALLAFDLSTAFAARPLPVEPEPSLVACIEPVLPSKSSSDAKRVSYAGRIGLVHEFEFEGDYERGLTQARQDVGRAFFDEQADDVDFLVVFTTFEFGTGDATAFYNPVRNDVEGIGNAVFDHSAQFGSSGRLQGYVDMAAVSRYELNARNAGYKTSLNVLAHELMHRWGVGVHYRAPDGSSRSDLLGQDGSHWSLLADTSASVMYGGSWQEQSPGEFLLVEARERYSPWDLYLAGFASAEEVPPMRLLRGSGLDPAQLPLVGEMTMAQPEFVLIDQVIAEEGARIPAAADSQRAFRVALLLLRRPGESLDEGMQVRLQRFALAFESYFQAIAGGRASLRFVGASEHPSEPGAPLPLIGSSPQVHADPVAAGLAWLKSRQTQQGAWHDRANSVVRDTAAAKLAIAQLEPHYPGLQAADDFLSAQPVANLDELARLAQSVAGIQAPAWPLGEAGGAGVALHWSASPLDTALALRVDAERSWLSTAQRSELAAYAMQVQRDDGAWGVLAGGPGRLRSTLYAARALLASSDDGASLDAGVRARGWIEARVREMPLQGPLAAPSSELAEALALAGPIGLAEDVRQTLLTALLARQGAEGDWDGSVHTTATVLLAIALQTQPNLLANAAALDPAEPVLGEPVRLTARVGNNGGQPAPESLMGWYRDGHPNQGGSPLTEAIALPMLLPGEHRWMQLDIESESLVDGEQLHVAVDPDDTVVEASEADNAVTLDVRILPRPDAIDLGLYRTDLNLSPAQFERIGQRIDLQGRVRNLGTVPATAVVLRLERVRGSVRSELASTTLDIAAATGEPFHLEFEIAELGDHALELSVDPDGLLAELRRENNRLALQLPAGQGTDLALDAAGIEWMPATPVLGNDVRLSVQVENPGMSDSPGTELALELEADGAWQPLLRRPLSVAAGGQTEVEFIWRPGREGVHRLRLQADPDGHVAELDETNNIAETSIDIGRSNQSDLVLQPGSITIDPTPPLQGAPLLLDARVRNIGNVAAGPFSASLHLGDPRSGGLRLATRRLSEGLAANEEASLEFVVDDFPRDGDIALFVLADSELEVAEGNEENNLGVRETTALGLPDLEVTSASLQLDPESPVPGLPIQAAVRVSNVGGQTSAPVLVHLFERAGAEQRAVGLPASLPALEPGEAEIVSFQWSFGDLAQVDSLYLQVDPEQSLREAARHNNETSLLLATQSGEAFAVPPYFSPNGDGIKDSVAVSFALALPDLHRIEVGDSQGRVIADLTDRAEAQGERVVVRWDGTDSRGRQAWDGIYRIDAKHVDGRVIGPARVVLDTDRPPALEAVLGESALQRTLPSSEHPWLPAPPGSSVEDYVFARGHASNLISAMRRGVVRTHALLGGVEPVISARWLDSQGGGPGSVEVVDLALNPNDDGRLLLLLERSGLTSLWVQDAGGFDSAQFVLSLPESEEDPRILGSFDGDRLLIGGLAAGADRWIVDLATGELRSLDQGWRAEVLKVYPQGVLLGTSEFDDGTLVPSRFVPLDAAQPVWDLPIWFDPYYHCLGRVHVLPDAPVLLWHEQGGWREEVRILRLDARESHVLIESEDSAGCQRSTPSMAKGYDEGGALGFSTLRAFWLEREAEALVLDYSAGRLHRFDRQGGRLAEVDIPMPQRSGDYAPFSGIEEPTVVRGEIVSEPDACPGRVHDDWNSLAQRGGFQRRAYEAASDRIFLPFGELAMELGGDDPRDAGAKSDGAALCEGATDYLGIGLGDGTIERLGGVSRWPLALAHDQQAYPAAILERGRVVAPADWPVFLHGNGTRLRRDGRVERADGSTGPSWPFASRLRAAIHGETRLEIGAADEPDRLDAVLSSLERLRAELRASSDGRSVRLSGIASDRHLDHYMIEYAHAESPEHWLVLLPPQSEQVRLDDFVQWAPPQAGAYLFRLTVVDKAGNRRSSQVSADVVFAAPIRDVRQDHRAISPNGDAVQDSMRLEFVVSRPHEQRFSVHDALGRAVYSEDRVYGESELGQQVWTWDGRDQDGWYVPDGRYRVRLSTGFEFPVLVDSQFPEVEGELQSVYPPAPLGLQFFADDRIGVERGASLSLSLQRRALGEAEWRTVAEELPRPQAELDQTNWPWVPLSETEYFGFHYRLVAVDGGGNRSVHNFALPAPAFHLLRADEPDAFAPIFTPNAPFEWQAMPFASVLASDVPIHAARFGSRVAETIVAPGAQRPVFLRWSAPEPGEVVLDLARLPSDFSGDSVLDWRTVSTGVVRRREGHTYEIGADFTDFELGQQAALRLRTHSGGGSDLESNAFRFIVGGLRLDCLDLITENIGAEALLRAPIQEPRLRVHYRDGLRPPVWLAPVSGSLDASGPVGSDPRRSARFKVPHADEVDRVELAVVDGLGREHSIPPAQVEFCPLDAALPVSLRVVPKLSGTCEASPSGAVQAILGFGAESRGDYRLELLDPRRIDPVLLASGSAHGEAEITHLVDTRGLGEGQARLRVTVTPPFGEAKVIEESFPVDLTPPQANILAPAPGERLCLIEGADDARLLGEVATDTRLEYLIETAVGASPEPSFQPWKCSFGPTEDCRPALEAIRYPFRQRTISGLLVDFARDPEEMASLGDGPVALRLRAADWSGAQSCSLSEIQLDAKVDLAERREPEPLLPGQGNLVMPAISWRGDAEYRVARWFWRAREMVRFSAALHATEPLGPLAPGRYRIVGQELASLRDEAPASGDIDIAWDAHLLGSPAADGVYGLRVRVSDDCGHEAVIDRFVRVDTTPPELHLAQPLDGAELSSPTVEIVGAVQDALPDGYAVDISRLGGDGPWLELSSGRGNVAVPSLLALWQTHGEVGPAWIRLRAHDLLGNAAQTAVVIQLLPREPVLDSARLTHALFSPNADGILDATEIQLVLNRPARVDISVRDGDGAVMAQLADAVPRGAGLARFDWAGSAQGAVLADGDYSIWVRATDQANSSNVDEVELSVVLDAAAPVLRLLLPEGEYASCDDFVALDVDDPHLHEYDAALRTATGQTLRSAGGVASETVMLGELAGLDEGEYEIFAQASDRAGNRGELRHDFNLDCTPPHVAIHAPGEGAVVARAEGRSTAVVASAQDDRFAGLQLRLLPTDVPGAPTVLAEGPAPIEQDVLLDWSPQVEDGDYVLSLVASDLAGNEAEQGIALRIDGTPPVAIIHAPLDGALVTRDLSLRIDASDRNFANFRLLAARPADAASDQWTELLHGEDPVVGDYLAPASLAWDGDLVLRLEVEDRAGLTSFDEVQVEVDSIPPPAPIDLIATQEGDADARLAWSGGDAPDLRGFDVYRLPHDWSPLNPQPLASRLYLDRDLGEGEWHYYVVARDLAGNRSEPSNVATVRIDRTPPEVRLQRPRAGERVRGRLVVAGTAHSDGDFDRYDLHAAPSDGSPARPLRESSVPVRDQVLAEWDTRDLAEETPVELQLRAWDRSGNLAQARVTVIVDNLPPQAPTGLVAQDAGEDVEVAWDPNAEPDLLGYLLYRNGSLLGYTGDLPEDLRPLALPENGRVDAGAPDGEVAYRVYAVDLAGNVSPPSLPATLQRESGPPDLEIVRPSAAQVFESAIEILAESQDRDIASVAFAYRALGDAGWIALGAPQLTPPWREVFDPDGLEHGEYELTALATDQLGQTDPEPPSVIVRFADLTPPARPAGLRARARGDRVQLEWDANAEPDLAGYRVERETSDGSWIPLQPWPQQETRYEDGERPLGTHRYRVVALDLADNESTPSPVDEAIVFVLALGPQPFTPDAAAQAVLLQGSSPRTGSAWLRHRWPDGEQELQPGSVEAAIAFAFDSPALEPGSNVFALAVEDALGNRSLEAELTVTHGVRPDAVQGLSGSVDGSQVSLSWQAADASTAIGYRVYRNGRPLDSDALWTQSIQASSAGQSVPQVLDGRTDTAWTQRTASLSDVLDDALRLEWDAADLVGGVRLRWRDAASSARDFDLLGWFDGRWNTLAEVRNQGASEYWLDLADAYPTAALRLMPRRAQSYGAEHALVEIEVLRRVPVDSTERVDTAADGRHRYEVAAISPLGFEGPLSQPWVAEVGDFEAPPPVVLSGTLDGRDAQLEWTASAADDLSVYRLLRDGVALVDLPADQARMYTDAALFNGRHSYRVVVEDQAGNQSAPSNTVELEVVGDLPGTPHIVEAVADAQQPALLLHWVPGEGAPAVGYRLYASHERDGSADPYREVARPSTSPWLHTGLHYGERLFYRIQAEDAYGNLSALSEPFEAEVRNITSPQSPRLTWPTVPGRPVSLVAARFDVCGVAEAGLDVRLYLNDAALASLQVPAEASEFAAHEPQGLLYGAALSPDGQLLYWSDDGNGASAVPLDEPEASWSPPSRDLEQLSFDREGRTAYGLNRYWGRVYAWSIDGWSPQQLDLGVDSIEAAAMHPDGYRWLLEGRRLGEAGLWLVDFDEDEVSRVELPEPERVLDMAWNGALDAFYLLLDDGSLWRSDGPGSAPVPMLVGSGGVALDPSPREDAVLLVVTDAGGDRLLLVRSGQAPETLLDGVTRIDDARFSPDGAEFAVLLPDRIERRALESGELIESMSLTAASDRGRRLHWSPSWRLLLQRPGTDEPLQLFDPSGAFCARELTAVPGLNVIDADAQRSSGATSLRSQPIELELGGVAPDLLPDLALTAEDIRFLPGSGAPGQHHAAVIAVRNIGLERVWDAQIDVLLVQPDGSTRPFHRTTSVSPGRTAIVSVPLGMLALEGEYYVHVTLDPFDSVAEADERNNTAAQRMRLSANPVPLLRLSAASPQVGPDEQFEGEVSVETTAPFEGRVQLRIVDSEGNPVADLANEATGPIAGAAQWTRAWNWSPQAAMAGGYRLEGLLLDRFDVPIASAQLELEVGAQHLLALVLQPHRTSAVVGEGVSIELGLDYLAGNALLIDGQLRLSAVSPDGGEQALWSGPTGLLMAGYSLRRTVTWQTSPGFDPGAWTLRLDLAADNVERILLREVVLQPEPPADLLDSRLELRPGENLILGQSGELEYRIENLGQVAHLPLELRVLVLREGASTPSLTAESTVPLPPGAHVVARIALDDLPQQAAAYVALLQARVNGIWRPLAQRGFAAVDGMPPDAFLLAPALDRPHASPSAIEVEAFDRHSRVERVEFSLDGGAWQALAATGQRFHAVVQSLVDGEHALRLRASDIWGNRRDSGPFDFTVDNSPPWIEIDGVEDGGHYASAVLPHVQAIDAHLEQLSVWLNGQPFALGSAIQDEGSHSLLVIAIDAAGNRSERSLQFALDMSAPDLQIVEPIGGAVLYEESVPVQVETEPLAEVQVENAGWIASAEADANGRVRFPAVPLLMGENRIEARAWDRAGNQSSPSIVDVVRLSDQGEVGGTVQIPGVSHGRGDDLGIGVQVQNERHDTVAGVLSLRVATAAGSELQVIDEVVQLTPGQTLQQQHALATGGWPLGPLLIELALEEGGTSLVLDTASLELVDASAPLLTALAPDPASLLPGAAQLAVQAVDDEAVSSAEARIDRGAWQPLQRVGVDDAFAAEVDLADGSHQVEYRARDAAGNVAQLDAISFAVDTTPPQILVEGVQDGGIYGRSVAPVVAVLDAHPDQLQLRINDQPFVSGQPIATSGTYILQAEATDLASHRSERSLRFEVDLEPPTLQVHTPSEGELLAAPEVLVTGTTEAGAQVRLVGPLSSHSTTADATGSFTIARVQLAEGENRLRVVATDALLRDSEPVERIVFHSAQAAQGLAGSLSVDPATVPAGAAFDIVASIEEQLGLSRDALSVRLSVARGASTLAVREWTTGLGAHAHLDITQTFADLATHTGHHRSWLEVELDGAWQVLAQSDFQVVDRLAPDLAWIGPDEGSYHAGIVRVRIGAHDAHGMVARVQARIAAGGWVDLQPVVGENAVWGGSLTPATEGDVLLEARALDAAMNLSDPVPLRVVLDRTAPVIVLSGIADGEVRNQPLRIGIAVHDASPTEIRAELDGQPIVSGQQVDAHGLHRLLVSAEDAAGNRADASLGFEIDLLPPDVAITAPRPGSVLQTDQVDVLGRSEALAAVEIEVGEHRRSTYADVEGWFRLASVPLRPGANLIRARATDRAGNLGPWTEVAVERRGGFALTGRLQLPATQRLGQTFGAQVRIENQAADDVADLSMRLIASTSQGFERQIDLRRVDLGGHAIIDYEVAIETSDWPEGTVSLRLLADEVQLAIASVELQHGSALPAVPQPRVIPVLGPLPLLALLWLMLWSARGRLTTRGRPHA